ncbi:mannose-6-phosphate isomerase [Corynebacterium jeikeium]|uniref:mannose-6-phosphate isomerase n=1 Tax=Corynebacterium jeikeium (strain K411) TaxID=306537 RepID=Q4JTP2_CORJK|nr:mannose-6-phosphate isomerase, class I [Corynebacterium jeikeium]CAI37815.1 mannose-6-phosphate isomerase [Corynebacterium jeikeium K411]SCX21799.1 Mannose-6-phosphate isomerase [Corynebacterium jeikeium]SUY84846.1 mannose-6-phosphate isomerase [Corynebacterium jeikeium]
MRRIEGAVQNYAWGSHESLAKLQGRPTPTEQPEAELWFGAHPGAPGVLLDLIEADPEGQLGQGRTRLPFLLKLLAAERALSIQVHPTKAQAEAGFAADEAAGIARDAFERNYKDDNHKPELLVALGEFEAMAGFRPVARTAELLDKLALPELNFLRGDLRGAVERALHMPAEDLPEIIDALTRRCRELAASADDWMGEVADLVVRLEQQYPNDRGVLFALLLNRVVLQEGEALYLDAGQLHAYVRGTGVEIMANSDNVLRCGLTPKHIDVEELLSVVRWEELADPRLQADAEGAYHTPAEEFSLRRVSGEAEVAGPAIVLAVGGTAECGELRVDSGSAAWVPAGEEARVSGKAFIARPGA